MSKPKQEQAITSLPHANSVALYCRTSKDGAEGEKQTIAQQIEAGKAWAKANYPDAIINIYPDPDESAYTDDLANRPGMLDLLRDVKAHKVNIIWVWEYSRLSRKDFPRAIIFFEFEKAGIKLYINGVSYSFDNPSDRLFLSMLAAFAEYERALIVGRTNRGQLAARKEGIKVSKGLYGYTKTGFETIGHNKKRATWAIDKKAEAHVKLIFSTLIETQSLRATIRKLEGINDPTKILNRTSWYTRLLRHIEYTGQTLHPETGEPIACKTFPKEIVTPNIWQKANKILDTNKVRRDEDSDYLLSSHIICAKCGLDYYHVLDKSSAKHYYRHNASSRDCKNNPQYIPMVGLDDCFDFIFTRIGDAIFLDSIKDYFAEKAETRKKLEQQVKTLNDELEKQLHDVEGIITRLLVKIETEDDAEQLLLPRLKQRKEEADKLRLQIAQNRKSIIGDGEQLDMDIAIAEIKRIEQDYKKADTFGRRNLIDRFCKITKDMDRIRVEFEFGLIYTILLPKKMHNDFTIFTSTDEYKDFHYIVERLDGKRKAKIVHDYAEDVISF